MASITQFWEEISETSVLIRGYALLLASVAVGGTSALVAGHVSFGNPWSIAALALIAAIAERGSIRLTSTTEESISLLPMLFAAVLFGPAAAALVGAASMLGDLRRPYLRWIVYCSTRSITGAVTGLVCLYARMIPSSVLGGIAVATALGALVAESLDVGF